MQLDYTYKLFLGKSGGPISKILCMPLAAISKALLALNWPLTSEKSTLYFLAEELLFCSIFLVIYLLIPSLLFNISIQPDKLVHPIINIFLISTASFVFNSGIKKYFFSISADFCAIDKIPLT